jgi:hypothetical protein
LSCLVSCGARTDAIPIGSDLASAPPIDASPEVDASVEGAVTVQGTLGGRPFSPTGAVGVVESISGTGFIELPENFDLTCDSYAMPPKGATALWHANGVDLDFSLHVDGSNGPPFLAGTYRVAQSGSGVTAMTVDATYKHLDSDCNLATSTLERATSGTVTVTAVDSATISGSFDLAFPSGDSAAGRFSGPVCSFDVVSGPQGPQGLGPVCLH